MFLGSRVRSTEREPSNSLGRGGATTQKKVLSRKSMEMVAQGSLGFRGYLFRRISGYNTRVHGSTVSEKILKRIHRLIGQPFTLLHREKF